VCTMAGLSLQSMQNDTDLAKELAQTMERGPKARFGFLLFGLLGFFFPAFAFTVAAKGVAKAVAKVPSDKLAELQTFLMEIYD
jgi:hypothetical protein